MDKKRGDNKMFISTVIMGILAVVLVLIGYFKGEHLSGLNHAVQMTIQILPLLIFAFIVAGMVKVLLPSEVISKWIGQESGIRGILIGTVAGAFTPGGPYVSMPLAAGLLKSGASIGIMTAYLTAWSLINISRLPLDIGILGLKFSIIRFISVIIFPPIAGLFAQVISKVIK